MKTLVYSSHGFDKPYLERANSGKHELIFIESPLREDTAHIAAGCEAVALFSNDHADADVLRLLHKLGVRFIALRSTGYDHVDLPTAQSLGMKVAHVPAYSPQAIAEHAVAMLLALNRRLLKADRLVRQYDFRLDELVGFNIHGKIVGIIGGGHIGLAFARIMLGFGAHLLVHDPVINKSLQSLGVRYVTLESLLENSDIVSLHCPLNDKTRYLIDTPQFNLMKKSAILINTARGAVVRTSALIKALNENRIAGACLDVYEREKGLYFQDHRNSSIRDDEFARLLCFENVLITAHQAFLTREALSQIAAVTIANLNHWQEKGHSPNDLY
ncbi:MAG: 2-hydroxyacid dehydrogenase [Chitinophagales bacterium]|nr:2-hydroxyacid dehydrogenase [Chitinophagales bacterium]MDW8418445.1 2-hydroxyacid dehydrogenase [Chitinophagales bacterium]